MSSVIYPLVVSRTVCELQHGDLLFRAKNGEFCIIDDWDRVYRDDLVIGCVVYADPSPMPQLAHSICFSGDAFVRSYWGGLDLCAGTRVALMFFVDRVTNAVVAVEEQYIKTGQCGMFSVTDDFSSGSLEDLTVTTVAELLARRIRPTAVDPKDVDVCIVAIGTVLDCTPCMSCTWVQFVPPKSVRAVSFKSNVILDISCGSSYRARYTDLCAKPPVAGLRRLGCIRRLQRI
jgi:hypothetical protein